MPFKFNTKYLKQLYFPGQQHSTFDLIEGKIQPSLLFDVVNQFNFRDFYSSQESFTFQNKNIVNLIKMYSFISLSYIKFSLFVF